MQSKTFAYYSQSRWHSLYLKTDNIATQKRIHTSEYVACTKPVSSIKIKACLNNGSYGRMLSLQTFIKSTNNALLFIT